MEKILIVDDNGENRYFLEALLGNSGYAVESANDGLAALAAARKSPPQLIIADILMPVMDGYELCREWRRDPALAPIPFIFYTATYTERKDEAFALSLGADRFLIKPQPPEELLREIGEVLAGTVGRSRIEDDPEWSLLYLKGHNEALLRKLHKKMDDLVRMNGQLTLEMQRRKEAERQLVQAQKMEAVGRMASGIAHDFNNILTVMYGMTQLLKDALPEEGSAQAYTRELVSCMDRAATLSRSILSVSRRQELLLQPVNLNSIVRDLRTILQRILHGGIELCVELCANDVWLNGDHGQLDQVLMNLVVNAGDAIGETGTITIRTSREEKSGAAPLSDGPYAVLTVTDTGCGIDETTREHIFEPFFSTKNPERGTGLGLAIVFGIVKAHGADIEVTSAPGMGTSFTLRFACVPKPAGIPGPLPPGYDCAAPRSGKILLVDDDPQVRTSTRLILEKAGHAVLEAASEPEAAALLDDPASGISLAVIDLFMPGHHGFDVFRHSRATRPEIPVILLSGYSPDILADKLGNLLHSVHLVKPVQPIKFLQAVEDCLRKHAPEATP